MTVNYTPALSNTKLNKVDVLLTDIDTGYMLGWVSNTKVPINADISLEKFCICTWIDESSGTIQGKEKYLPGQDIELIRYVFAFNDQSNLIKRKEYNYSRDQKKEVLRICERNSSNILIDSRNAHFYTELAISENIHCKINGVQY